MAAWDGRGEQVSLERWGEFRTCDEGGAHGYGDGATQGRVAGPFATGCDGGGQQTPGGGLGDERVDGGQVPGLACRCGVGYQLELYPAGRGEQGQREQRLTASGDPSWEGRGVDDLPGVGVRSEG